MIPKAQQRHRFPTTAGTLSLALAALALAAWLSRHPFEGVEDDGRLYAVQALKFNTPGLYHDDLFFKFGSQDSFTLFSPLYGWAIRLAGLDMATQMLVVAGHVMWIAGAAWLIRAIAPQHLFWLAAILLACLPTDYGGAGVLGFAEGFLTPRIFAEAFGLGAIAAAIRARPLLAGALLCAGALFHPLMIMAPAATVGYLLLRRPGAWWAPLRLVALGTAGVLILLTAAHLGHISLLPEIDPEWRRIIQIRSPHLFVGNWEYNDWFRLGTSGILVILAAFRMPAPVQTLLLTVLSISLACVLISFIGFDLLGNLLLGKAQIWRATWLLHVFAWIALGLVIGDLASRKDWTRIPLLTAAFSLALVAAIHPGIPDPVAAFAFAACLAALLYLDVRNRTFTSSQKVLRRILWTSSVVMAAAAVLLTGLAAGVLIKGSHIVRVLSDTSPAMVLAPAALLMAAAAILLVQPRRYRAAILAASIAAVALCLLSWDRRSDWRRFLDSAPDINAQLAEPIAETSSVYWQGNVEAVWLGLRRTSYYSTEQGAGAIFNRGTAVEFLRRLRIVERFEADAPWQAALLGQEAPARSDLLRFNATPSYTSADVLEACRQAGGPDVLVLDKRLPDLIHEVWTSPAVLNIVTRAPDVDTSADAELIVNSISDFFVYRCRDLLPP